MFKNLKTLVNEIKKLNESFMQSNTERKQLLQLQKETNTSLENLIAYNQKFLEQLTHFIAIREKMMIEQAQKEAKRELESKPTEHDLLF